MSGESLTLEEHTKTDEQFASFILDTFQKHDSSKEGVKQHWNEVEAYKYATDTNNSIMGTNAFDHSTHIPVLSSISQDLEAIISQTTTPHEDWFDFSPEDRSSANKKSKNKVKAFLKNRHRVDDFNDVKRKLDSDYVTYGNAFAMVEFIDESQEEKTGYIGPRVIRISPYDIVFDPTAANFERTPKIIRTVVDIGTIAEWVEKGAGNTKVLIEVLESRSGNATKRMTHHEKNQQYVPQGFNNYDSYQASGYLEVLWFYGNMYDPATKRILKNRKMASIDGKWLIFNEEIDTPTGKPMIFKASFMDRPDNLWGMGPLDNIVGLNYQINHRENAKNDALDKLINPDLVKLGDVEEIYDDETGRIEYIAPEGGGVQELGINTQFFQFSLEVDRLEDTSRKAARLPSDIVGFRTPGEKTFGEVSALTEGAMRGFIHKVQSYERFLEKILQAELVLSAKNLSTVLQVPGQVENGVIPFLEITKKDLEVTGALIAKGSQRFARKNQVLSTLTQLSATPLLQVAAPHISGKALAFLVEELAELDGTGIFEEFVAISEQTEAQIVAQQAQQIAAMSASEPTIQEELINQELDEGM